MSSSNSLRLHIGLFGNTNSGKSSVFNAIFNQDIAVVSNSPGTTTDSVSKAIELPSIGPCLIFDTPGFDDSSSLAELRINKTYDVASKVDIAIFIINSPVDKSDPHIIHWINIFNRLNTPFDFFINNLLSPVDVNFFCSLLSSLIPSNFFNFDLTSNLCSKGDSVLLVMPQDSSAPKDRLILPQVQTIRHLLDKGCLISCTTPDNLLSSFQSLISPPNLIITDSQAFNLVFNFCQSNFNKPLVNVNEPLTNVNEHLTNVNEHLLNVSETPSKLSHNFKLTSFSILFAYVKGDLDFFLQSAKSLINPSHTLNLLIAEACSHIPQSEDIGRVKLPNLLRSRLGNVNISFCNGSDFPDNLSSFDLIIHCGACMFNRKFMLYRIRQAKLHNVPMTNYGIAIATLLGIIDKVALPHD